MTGFEHELALLVVLWGQSRSWKIPSHDCAGLSSLGGTTGNYIADVILLLIKAEDVDIDFGRVNFDDK